MIAKLKIKTQLIFLAMTMIKQDSQIMRSAQCGRRKNLAIRTKHAQCRSRGIFA